MHEFTMQVGITIKGSFHVFFTFTDKKVLTTDKQKIEAWLNARLKTKRLKVVYEN